MVALFTPSPCSLYPYFGANCAIVQSDSKSQLKTKNKNKLPDDIREAGCLSSFKSLPRTIVVKLLLILI